ncbi:MlaD family protein [Pseudonocardia spinosispora]|uniref:MlaD family protein n=1 Tax=Pseudonocardia spinosispora TaxID=103441 RepID=UPI00040077B4|nr:MlaD family protein [Pseudonocardia spinosispora]
MKLIPRKKQTEDGESSRWEGAPKALGVVMMILLVLAGVGAFMKDEIASILTPGDMITASFSRQYRLQPYKSVVKVAEVKVGEVTDIETADDGVTKVTMRLDHGVIEKLGSDPTAAIRPTLVVGGIYYIEITTAGRGGRFSGDIPLGRTTVPVELDQVLTPIDPSAQKGMQTAIKQVDATLQQGGKDAIRKLVDETPDTLRPASVVLNATRGTDPERDLPRLVAGLENFSADFTKRDGQLASNINGLHTLSATFAAARGPVAQSFASLPQTLRTTRAGMIDLQPTLDKLTDTAPDFRESARELDPFLEKLDPVLHRARPVVSDLRDVLEDAKPLVQDLVPTADKATDLLEDLRGPVLDRLNGPIIDALNSPWHGTGAYAGGGNDHKLYEEIAYFNAVTDQVWMHHGRNGGWGRLMAGIGGNTLTGGSQFPRTLEQDLEAGGLAKPIGPQDATPKGQKPAPTPPPHPNPPPLVPPQKSHGSQSAPGDANLLLPGGLGGNK